MEQLNDLGVSVFDSPEERGAAVGIPSGKVSAGFQEEPRHLRPAALRCQMQRGFLGIVLEMDVRTSVQEQPDNSHRVRHWPRTSRPSTRLRRGNRRRPVRSPTAASGSPRLVQTLPNPGDTGSGLGTAVAAETDDTRRRLARLVSIGSPQACPELVTYNKASPFQTEHAWPRGNGSLPSGAPLSFFKTVYHTMYHRLGPSRECLP